jgi:hypothetical protein
MDPNLVNWLLDGPSWIRYRTRIDLLGDTPGFPEVQAARQEVLDHPGIKDLMTALSGWPGYPLKRHNDAGHPLHKLAFLADLGLLASDPGMQDIVARILDHQSSQGPFQVVMNVHPRYGGSGQDQLVWMLCDAPVVLYSLVKLGLSDHPQVQRASRYLAGLIQENGWPCMVAPELGKFKGPGRRSDPCPYANLVMLKVLGLLPAWRDHEVSHKGAEVLLGLWEKRKEVRPYLFAMGTHFSRLKAPLIWYDMLHVVDVLSLFPWLHTDPRFIEMLTILENKANAQGRFTPDSVWQAWKGWEFSQKQEPSRWITLLSRRILFRIRNLALV